ncbi:hypothetical protein Tco_0218197 [Tanacetum coccineum]
MEILPESTSNSSAVVIMEYLVNISKRSAFWSLNEDILRINYSDYQYAVSIKEDMAYPCLHSPKTTKETSSIRRIQRRPIRRIEDIVCEDSGRYQAWSLLQETPNTPYLIPWIRDSSKLNLPDHSFQDNEHVGRDTRTQGGKRFKDKDLKISRVKSQDKVKAKDQDIKVKLRDIKSKIKIQDHKHAKGTSKEFPRTQGSKIQDVTSREAISSMTTP